MTDTATWPAPSSAMAPVPYRVRDRVAENRDSATLSLEPVREPLPAPRPGEFMMMYAFGVGEIAVSVSVKTPCPVQVFAPSRLSRRVSVTRPKRSRSVSAPTPPAPTSAASRKSASSPRSWSRSARVPPRAACKRHELRVDGHATCVFDRIAGTHLIGDRANAAHPRGDVRWLGVGPATQECLEKPRRLINVQLDAFSGSPSSCARSATLARAPCRPWAGRCRCGPMRATAGGCCCCTWGRPSC